MIAEEFNEAKEILTEKVAYRAVLDELAKTKSDESEIGKIFIRAKGNKECSLDLSRLPTSIKEQVSTIIKDAHVAFEVTVAHRIKSELTRLDEEFKQVSCTKE